MSKSTFFTGQPLLNQVIKLIPRSLVDRISKAENSDRYVKKFKSFDHLVSMLYCSFSKCSSLRELTTGIQASSNRLSHLGLTCTPRRSTISDANKRRHESFFGTLFHELVKLYYPFLPDSRQASKLEDRLFIVDSTTVSLFSNVMKGAGDYGSNGRKKGGAKAHVLLKAKEDTPVFVRLSEARRNDQVFMDQIQLPPGSVIVMDKAYASSRVQEKWTQHAITWVTRMRQNTRYETLQSFPLSEEEQKQGVFHDSRIKMGRASNKTTIIQQVRLIGYTDPQSKRKFEFLTNNFDFETLQIAQIYQQRWQIELMFKRLKTSFPLKYFLGDNPNAIKIQIWSSLIADLLVK